MRTPILVRGYEETLIPVDRETGRERDGVAERAGI